MRFLDFADSTLNFAVYYSIAVGEIAQRGAIASRLRFKIDELFRKHSVNIAFPQRDVHLTSLQPIEVKVLNSNH